ncbi:MAG TPA: Nif11-like leader peptide family natural product precursor [Cyanophyceae cyanobacterium]
MAREDVVKLFRAAQLDPSLKETLNTAPNAEAFVKMAQELGYNFTVEEWQTMTRFSVEELEGKLSEIPGI